MHAHDSSSFSLDPNNPEDAELIEFFIEELPERVDSLRSAVSDEDFELVQRLAHQLKGAAPGYGFPQIGTAAGALEAELREATIQSVEQIQGELDTLIRLCESYTKGS